MTTPDPLRILVDADACPVKEEIYRVAARHRVPVSVVSNSPFRVPVGPMVERVVVHGGFDAADDWIAEQAALRQARGERTLVVTADILLADRCLKAAAPDKIGVLAPNGRPFTRASIGSAIATRAIMADLRAGLGAGLEGGIGGPRRSPRRTGQGSCRRWMRGWCGWGGLPDCSGGADWSATSHRLPTSVIRGAGSGCGEGDLRSRCAGYSSRCRSPLCTCCHCGAHGFRASLPAGNSESTSRAINPKWKEYRLTCAI